MWFIGVGVEQETTAPPPKKKSWIRPCSSEEQGQIGVFAGYYDLITFER